MTGTCGDECDGRFRGEHKCAWLDVKLVTCTELTADGPAEVVMRDFASA